MDFSIWGEYIGGALVALYAIWNIVNKFLDQTAGRKKKIEEKKAAEKEEFNKQVYNTIEPIIKPLNKTVEEIKKLNEIQNEELKNLTISNKDILRKMIMDIYHKYEDVKKIPRSVRDQLDKLYDDYKALNGNSYIDKYYSRAIKWEVIEDHDII